jgi:uncharacterized OB-fold protein/acyl dehydratase
MTERRESLLERLRRFEGVALGEPTPARDPVNQPMIHHWCDAIQDRNPVYTDPEFASRSTHGGIVAPPTMLQAWTMPGYRPAQARASGAPMGLLQLLDEAGFTSVIATNCTQEYRRYLRPGDHVSVTQAIESVSEEKQTALGAGHFVTQLMTYRDQRGEEVATMRFRLLKFRPRARKAAAPPDASKRPRPRPAITHDNRFFWEGIDAGRLLIQRCRCGALRHPPGPMCPTCHSLEWDAVEASGRGTVYSYVVAHHPAIPPFEYPNLIVLVALEEGTRIVSNLVGVEPDAVRIGMPVRARFVTIEGDRTLLQFEPAAA